MPFVAYTRRRLLAELRAAGFALVREGRHEVWGTPDGRRFTVPRGSPNSQVSGNVVATWRRCSHAAGAGNPRGS